MRLTYVFMPIFTLALMAEAQAVTPLEVCRIVASRNPDNGVTCSQIISSTKLNSAALPICQILANTDTSAAIDCLRAVGDNYFEAGAIQTCQLVATRNVGNTTPCLKASMNKSYLNSADAVCAELANRDTGAAVDCLSKSGGPIQSSTCPTGAEIKRVIDNSIDTILNGRVRVALQWLEQLSRIMGECR